MNNQLNPNARYPGRYSIEGEKLRIENKEGMTSVLFEDISSVSYKSLSQPRPVILFIGSLISLPLYYIGTKSENIWIDLLGLVIFIGFLVYTYKNKTKWDNVIVETRGGLLLFYSVESGQGISQVDKIENDRRKMLKIAK